MREVRRCEVCGAVADAHHIVSRGAGGSDEPYNLISLCRQHHGDYHQVGWVKFLEWFPALGPKVRTAREMAGRPTESRLA